MDVHQARVAAGLVAPHADREIVTGEHAAGLAGERAQQLELRRGQRELLVAGDRLHAGEVDDEASEAKLPILRMVGVDTVTTEQRLDASGELVVVERLANVVVGALAQAPA